MNTIARIGHLLLIATLLSATLPVGEAGSVKPTRMTCSGYTIRHDTLPSADEPERLTIRRGARILLTARSIREIEATCADMTGDGRTELIFQTNSGGAHCCFDIAVYQLSPVFRRILSYGAGNAGGYEIRRLADSIVLELGDDSFAYYKDLCYACSPANLPLVACYQQGQFVDCTRRYPQLVLRFVAFYKARLAEAKTFTDESRLAYVRGAALGIYAAYALMGRPEDGFAAVRRVTADQAVINWLAAQQADVRKWLARRSGYLKP